MYNWIQKVENFQESNYPQCLWIYILPGSGLTIVEILRIGQNVVSIGCQVGFLLLGIWAAWNPLAKKLKASELTIEQLLIRINELQGVIDRNLSSKTDLNLHEQKIVTAIHEEGASVKKKIDSDIQDIKKRVQ